MQHQTLDFKMSVVVLRRTKSGSATVLKVLLQTHALRWCNDENVALIYHTAHTCFIQTENLHDSAESNLTRNIVRYCHSRHSSKHFMNLAFIKCSGLYEWRFYLCVCAGRVCELINTLLNLRCDSCWVCLNERKGEGASTQLCKTRISIIKGYNAHLQLFACKWKPLDCNAFHKKLS